MKALAKAIVKGTKPTVAQLQAYTEGQKLPAIRSVVFKPGTMGKPASGFETFMVETIGELKKVLLGDKWKKYKNITVRFEGDRHAYPAHVEEVYEKNMLVVEELGIVTSSSPDVVQEEAPAPIQFPQQPIQLGRATGTPSTKEIHKAVDDIKVRARAPGIVVPTYLPKEVDTSALKAALEVARAATEKAGAERKAAELRRNRAQVRVSLDMAVENLQVNRAWLNVYAAQVKEAEAAYLLSHGGEVRQADPFVLDDRLVRCLQGAQQQVQIALQNYQAAKAAFEGIKQAQLVNL